MPRYIDADKVLETMRSNMDMQELYLPIHFINFVIDEMPTADVEPVRHGQWIKTGPYYYKCSSCGARAWIKFYPLDEHKFCWHCGAKMDGGENDE